jgi:hypothetical protein
MIGDANKLNLVGDVNRLNFSKDINKNASGDINKNAGGDIDKLNFYLNSNGTVTPTGIIGETTITPVVSMDKPTLKQRFVSTTDRMGITQTGKIVKGFFWGMAIATLSIVGLSVWKKTKVIGILKNI